MPTTPLRILIAEDETRIAALVEHWLTAEGHVVRTAGNAAEAQAELQRAPADLVITDILMPVGDGLDLIGAVKRAHPAVRLLAMSGGGHYLEGDDCLRMARGLGAHAAVMKPFTREQLLAAVAAALAPLRAP